mmetsp:Transcript_32930/g.32605  ORF Transcript_32930/g.32605 Transcript_32930/m.32605 type:complete len:343 (+) Transcript_32930:36-1064(+)
MIYRNLGNSGLKVSAIGFGNWLTGHNMEIEEAQFQCFQKSIDAGINFFDTAEVYGAGNAETVFGNILKRGDWDREKLVISTKFIRCGDKVGLSRKRLVQGMRNSLRRLQLDYVDVMFLHRYDQEVPLEETIRTVNHLIEKGKADYWGTSEFTAQEIQECHKICEKYGFIAPVADQCQYNLIVRDKVEVEYVPLYEKYGMGTTIWSPLMGGILSGKYNNLEFPEGSRLADPSLTPMMKKIYEGYFLPENREKTGRMLNGLGAIASELGCTQSQLALAWCVKNNDVSTAIFGATRPGQVEDNIGAIDLLSRLTPEILARIEELFATRPTPPTNWRTWRPMPARR